jgi:hypothetical protein
LSSHVRQDGARHSDESEEICLEDRSSLFDRALFRAGRGDPQAGVVHEQVDTSVQPHHVFDDRFDRFIAGHVEAQHLERPPTAMGSPSAGSINPVASQREPPRRGFANA